MFLSVIPIIEPFTGKDPSHKMNVSDILLLSQNEYRLEIKLLDGSAITIIVHA